MALIALKFEVVLDTDELDKFPDQMRRQGELIVRDTRARLRLSSAPQRQRPTAAQRGKTSYRTRHKHKTPRPVTSR
jgi:hypothetical protein